MSLQKSEAPSRPIEWHNPSLTRVPYRVYDDAALHAQEQQRLFHGQIGRVV